jgi:hypothetical protein
MKSFFLGLLAACALAVVPSATAAPVTHPFPSDDSSVVGSVGFIDANQVGYFWSAARGDLVSETFAGPLGIYSVTLNLEVIENALNSGAFVDWDVEINGIVVGSFTVNQGFLGPFTQTYAFPRIAGPMYTVTLRVTNEVAGGQGSHTLAYADPFAHSVRLSDIFCPVRAGGPCRIG